MRIFGDFATNFEADDRADAAGHPEKGGDRYAYQIGLGIGQLKKKKDWQIDAWWQHQDQYALDPNLVDTEMFDSKLNLEGVAVRAGYMLADAVSLNLTWSYAWQIDDSVGTGGTRRLDHQPGESVSIVPGRFELQILVRLVKRPPAGSISSRRAYRHSDVKTNYENKNSNNYRNLPGLCSVCTRAE